MEAGNKAQAREPEEEACIFKALASFSSEYRSEFPTPHPKQFEQFALAPLIDTSITDFTSSRPITGARSKVEDGNY
jgi:hypothetical protein